MIFLAPPYVSDFLRASVERQGLVVLDTPEARILGGAGLKYAPTGKLVREGGPRAYSNSENILDTISRVLADTDTPRQVEACKDKVRFREMTQTVFTGYGFTSASLDELETADLSKLTFPVVVKPARGFFSLGVHVVESPKNWPATVRTLREEIADFNANYPASVVDSGTFIIEEAIDGEEYAVDVYWDSDGTAVILNILHHVFSSGDDVSDRLYNTSSAILRDKLGPFTKVMQDIGDACGFKDFPAHIEIRVKEDSTIIPIEANPLRFAGWCVADITHYAWGFDPYEYYFTNQRPDWDTILPKREGKITSLCLADLPAGFDRSRIKDVDWAGLEGMFETVLDMRKINYREYPVLAFVFIETSEENAHLLDTALRTDFSQFTK